MPNEKERSLKEEIGIDLPSARLQSEKAITRIAIIGAGVMGRGIAQVAAQKGIEVVLVERDEKALEASLAAVGETLDQEIARWGITRGDKRAILSRITGKVTLEEVGDVQFVVEAVPDDLGLKMALFAHFDTIWPEPVIFVSNTSTLSVTEIAEVTRFPERVIGMHFLNPVSGTPLVEIVRALKTSDSTFARVKHFAEMLDKTVVEVFESPGYVTTRIVVPMLNEAMYSLMEGVASAEGIDTAMRLGYGFDKGPLALADMIGLDTCMSWMEALFREWGDTKYRPCPLLRKLVRAGRLGVKTGEGFFKYDHEGRRIDESPRSQLR
ncbi:MAG: 3-hydroxybutyryl-CoA dehydrogenase [Calditrichaeota bacterium]|nr:3-hydroxybutyryl-CoA dehydrogenase [Calditrichota bacterium]